MKRFLLLIVVLCLFGVPVAAVALAWLALEARPTVVRTVALTSEQIGRRSGGLDAPAYRRFEAEAERRIAALALYR